MDRFWAKASNAAAAATLLGLSREGSTNRTRARGRCRLRVRRLHGDCANGWVVMSGPRTCMATFRQIGTAAPQQVNYHPDDRQADRRHNPGRGRYRVRADGFGLRRRTGERNHRADTAPSPDTGFKLQNFTGDCAADGRTRMTAPRQCGAVFAPQGAGSATADCTGRADGRDPERSSPQAVPRRPAPPSGRAAPAAAAGGAAPAGTSSRLAAPRTRRRHGHPGGAHTGTDGNPLATLPTARCRNRREHLRRRPRRPRSMPRQRFKTARDELLRGPHDPRILPRSGSSIRWPTLTGLENWLQGSAVPEVQHRRSGGIRRLARTGRRFGDSPVRL